MESFKQEAVIYIIYQAIKEIDYLQKLTHTSLPSAEGTKQMLLDAIKLLGDKNV